MGSSSSDVKLLHLVRKLTNASNETKESSEIVEILRRQYREYRRHNIDQLSQQVVEVMEQIACSPDSKRKAEEAIYDEEAKFHDDSRGNPGGGLNASLRNRYRKIALVQQTCETARTLGDKPKEGESTGTKRRRTKLKNQDAPSSLMTGVSPLGNDDAALSPVERPTERFSDLGGASEVIQQVRQLIEYPMIRPELYRHLGVEPPRGVLLRGPPGTGKTHLANAIAGELGVPFFRVSAPEMVSGMSGESEGRIRLLFKNASDAAPSLIFLDELDAIAPKRSEGGSSRGMEKRMVAQLLTSMDSLSPKNNRGQAAVIVLAATNRPDTMDSALRRAGRFDREILMGVPDEDTRLNIIKTMTKGMRLSGDFDFRVLARKTPGFVGADVRSLTKEAAVVAINRIFANVLKGDSEKDRRTDESITTVEPLTQDEMEPLFVSMNDFLTAVPLVQPSSKREGFATVPDVSWDDIGALQTTRDELTLSVLEPIRSPEKFKALGLTLPAGVLLYGPPGCGRLQWLSIFFRVGSCVSANVSSSFGLFR